jgi:hypothetical protein
MGIGVCVAPGMSIAVKFPPSNRKPWDAPPASLNLPTIWPSSLMPKAWVNVAPGTSIVVKMPSSRRKPCSVGYAGLTSTAQAIATSLLAYAGVGGVVV